MKLNWSLSVNSKAIEERMLEKSSVKEGRGGEGGGRREGRRGKEGGEEGGEERGGQEGRKEGGRGKGEEGWGQ